MKRPIICLVTDGRMVPGVPRIDIIASAARAGVDLIQIREPGLDDRNLQEVVRAAVAATARTAARIVVAMSAPGVTSPIRAGAKIVITDES